MNLLGQALETVPDVEPIRSRKYTAEQVDNALLTVAVLGGNAQAAARRLREGGMRVTPQCLRLWLAKQYPKRYIAIAQRHSSEIVAVMVAKQREIVLRASDGELEAIDKSIEEVRDGKVKDASTTARNLAVAKGVAVSKIMELEGRPLVNKVEYRDAGELLRAIKAKITLVEEAAEEDQRVIEGEAEEE